MMTSHRTFTADPDRLYITDNGAVLCGNDLGSSAKYSGCDISGQPIVCVDKRGIADAKKMGFTLRCEQCGKKA